MAYSSPFTITQKEASNIVSQRNSLTDNMHFFLLHITFEPVYGRNPIPQSAYKKLPRLVNGIPLGAGKLSQSQALSIHWKYVEDGGESQTFLSCPLTVEEADQDRRCIRDHINRQSKAVFGDITVKMRIVLSLCIAYDTDCYVNDIADALEEGLQFHD